MMRCLALTLIPLLAWLSAFGQLERAHHAELGAWDAGLGTPAKPAPITSVQSLLRTRAARPADRHVPPDGGAAALAHASDSFTRLPRAAGGIAELAVDGSSARALAFPYDATAPPARS